MTSAQRDIRDVLAEMMRRERLGLVRPLWADWCEFDNEGGPEEWRRRADHLIRLLKEGGVSLVRTGEDVEPLPPPATRVICRARLSGRESERILRKDPGETWSLVTIEGGQETVEQSFTVREALLNGGLVLTDDPAAKKIPGLGRQLAALNEIYRTDAIAMEVTS